MTILSVQGVGKAFRHYHSEWHRFARWFGLNTKSAEEHWVLRNISFDIHPGEAIGIVGENGAGKSTLLKVITGTLQPTEGRVHINGRIAAILELGMGFNSELTGRQNVYHAAGLMGFSVEQIQHAMPDIEAFADIGEYFDEPVRTYSSGMQVRVAFAVATAYRPEILIIDEALSVGDAAFQRKCFRRIEGYKQAGTALLFVSHSVETVKQLCESAIFLDGGCMAAIGPAREVCDEYEMFSFGRFTQSEGAVSHTRVSETDKESSKLDPELVAREVIEYGNRNTIIARMRFQNDRGQHINVAKTGDRLKLSFDAIVAGADLCNPSIHLQIKTTEGVVIYGINTEYLNLPDIQFRAHHRYQVIIRLDNRLAPGTYFATCAIKEDGNEGREFSCRVVDGSILKVIDSENSTVARGMLDMRARFALLERTQQE